jgi:hypothetical protein
VLEERGLVRGGEGNCPSGLSFLLRPFGPGSAQSGAILAPSIGFALIESREAVRQPFNSPHSGNKKGHRDAATFFIRGGEGNCPSGLSFLLRPFGPGSAQSGAILAPSIGFALIESRKAVRRPFNSPHLGNKKGHRYAATFFIRGGEGN